MNNDRMTTSWWLLRLVIGAVALLAGLDKFFNLLSDWPAYLSPAAANALPVSATSFMHLVGVVEMSVGAVILSGYTRLGGYVASIWLLCIAANLVMAGRYFDVAVRDVVIAVAAFTLAQLSDIRALADAKARAVGPKTVTA